MKAVRLALMILALATLAAADKVVLKDGRTYDGVIVEENDAAVKIRTSKATLSIPRDQIASIERAGGATAEREKRLATLDPTRPAGYLETATWLAGDGKEACELPTLRRLCAAAAKLDPAQSRAAHMVLGRRLEETGALREAATAYARALLAKPGDPEAKGRIEALRPALETGAKAELADLAAAFDKVAMEKFDEALPVLLKAPGMAMAEMAPEMLGMSMAAFQRDIANRVKCRDCGGAGIRYCVVCEGKALRTCRKCNGTGEKEGAKGTDTESWADKACRDCYGLKSFLCERCKAERDIVISYIPMGNSRRADARVHQKAGAETEALKKELNLATLVQVHSGHQVWGIRAEEPTAGGKSTCATCAGLPFVAPANPPAFDRIRAFADEARSRAEGKKPYDPVPAPKDAFDAAAIEDGLLRYRNGKWIR